VYVEPIYVSQLSCAVLFSCLHPFLSFMSVHFILTNPRPLSQTPCAIKQWFVICLTVDFLQVCTGKSARWEVFTTFWCVVIWCDIIRDVFSWGRSTFTGLCKWPRSAAAVGSTWEWHSPPVPTSVLADYIRKTDEPLLAGQCTCASNFYTTLQRNPRFGLKNCSNIYILQFHPFGKLLTRVTEIPCV